MQRWACCAVALCGAALLGAGPVCRAQGSYHLLRSLPFGAAPGSSDEYFDYITVDPSARRVYLSRGTAVQVINADSGALIGYVRGFKRQHGVALAPQLDRGFISDGKLAEVMIFALSTLSPLGLVSTAPDADCILFEPVTRQVFTMNGRSASFSVIEAESGRLVRTLALGGAPEFAVADGSGMVYVNLVNKNQLAAIDARTLAVKARWSTRPAGEPTALAIDRQHRRLFSAGRKPPVLVIMDADSGKVLQSFPLSEGADAVAFDAQTGNIFVATRAGQIHIFHQDSPDQYHLLETVKSAAGAKTLGLDSRTHELFLDTADFRAPAAKANGAGAVQGTFRVLVYGR